MIHDITKESLKLEKHMISIALSTTDIETKAEEIRFALAQFRTSMMLATTRGFSDGFDQGFGFWHGGEEDKCETIE